MRFCGKFTAFGARTLTQKKFLYPSKKNDEKYYFQSYSECARFFKKVEHYELPTTLRYLGARREIIYGWKIKYFDEPRPKVGVEHSNKGKKHRRKTENENRSD